MDRYLDMNEKRVRGREELYLSFLSFVVFFGAGSFNVFNSFENNWNIFLFEVVFVLSSLVFLRDRIVMEKATVLYVFCIVGGVLLVNHFSSSADAGLTAWRRAVSFCFHFIFFLAFFRVLACYRFPLWGGVFGILASAFFAVFLIATTWVRLPFPETHDWVYGLDNFSNIRHLGYLLAVASAVSAWLFWHPQRKALCFLPVFIVMFSALLWTGGRAAIVAGCLGVLVCVFVSPLSDNKAKWLLFFLASFLAVLLSLHFSVQDPSMGLARVVSSEKVASGINNMSSGRVDMWLHVTSLIAERPLFGWGGEAYYYLRDVPGNVQAHNAVLQLLLEWGAFVAILVLGAIAYIYLSGFYMLFFCKERVGSGLVLGVSLATVLLSLSMLDGVFYHGLTSAMLSFSLAVLFFYRKIAKSKTKR